MRAKVSADLQKHLQDCFWHPVRLLDSLLLVYRWHPSSPDRELACELPLRGWVVSLQCRLEEEQKKQRIVKKRTALIARPKKRDFIENREKLVSAEEWRVILHNDDIHTFEYVTECIANTVRTVPKSKAYWIACEAHSNEIACVTETWKSMAKSYSLQLQKLGLTSSIAPKAGEEDGKKGGGKGGDAGGGGGRGKGADWGGAGGRGSGGK
mmetsp:Transcript_2829/g.5136  ORF Transcript_2829/g.5136 Transcript_2829/m.5136 type:complete len:210 (-) Transcript_2829:18-647(-)